MPVVIHDARARDFADKGAPPVVRRSVWFQAGLASSAVLIEERVVDALGRPQNMGANTAGVTAIDDFHRPSVENRTFDQVEREDPAKNLLLTPGFLNTDWRSGFADSNP
jgi:hypothetical protein